MAGHSNRSFALAHPYSLQSRITQPLGDMVQFFRGHQKISQIAF